MTIIREFDAPPEKVSGPTSSRSCSSSGNWPDGFEVTLDRWDCRTGGAYRITMAGEDIEGSVHGSFHDVIPNKLIVETFTPDGVPDVVILEKHRFEALGDGRTRLTATSLVDTFEHRDSFLDAGLVEGFTRLDDLLAAL